MMLSKILHPGRFPEGFRKVLEGVPEGFLELFFKKKMSHCQKPCVPEASRKVPEGFPEDFPGS